MARPPAPAHAAVALSAVLLLGAREPARDYPVKPVPFTAVHLADRFWRPRIEVNRAESPDGHVRNLLLPDDSALTSAFRAGLLGGVEVVEGRAVALARDARGQVTRREQELVAIPYYAWANRGPGEMAVWLANRETSARPQPFPTLASRAKVTSSAESRESRAVHDQDEPRSSRDPSSGFFHWWPKKGTTEWIQYDFEKAAPVSAVEVYWSPSRR